MELEEIVEHIERDGFSKYVAEHLDDAWKKNKKTWASDWEPALQEVYDAIPDAERVIHDQVTWTAIKNPKPWLTQYVRKLKLDEKFNTKRAEQLGASKIFDVLTHLDMSTEPGAQAWRKCDAHTLITLFESPGFNAGNLEVFDLRFFAMNVDWRAASEALARSPAMQTMRDLRIKWKYASGLIGEHFERLESLEFESLEPTPYEAGKLLSWEVLSQLRHLSLSGYVPPDFFSRLAERDNLDRIESMALMLKTTDYHASDLSPLAQMKSLGGLRELHVDKTASDIFDVLAKNTCITLVSLQIGRDVDVDDESFERYIAEPMASHLQVLDVRNYVWNESAAEAFEPSRLERRFGPRAMQALSKAAPPLERLILLAQHVDADALAALLESSIMTTLEHLDLRSTPLGNEGARVLAESSAVQGVEVLLYGAMLDEAGVAALEASPYIDEDSATRYRRLFDSGKFIEPIKDYNALIGEVRGLASARPHLDAFVKICKSIDDFARLEPERARDQALPYIKEAIAHWPRLTRMVVLSEHSAWPDYVPSSKTACIYPCFRGTNAEPEPHQLGVELVKGADIVLCGGYGRYNHSLKASNYVKNALFCGLEAVVFERAETSEEQEYEHDFHGKQIMEFVEVMPDLVEIHVGTSAIMDCAEFIDMLAAPHLEGRWQVLGFDRMDGCLEQFASKKSFASIEALYIRDSFSLDDFKVLYHSAHLGSLQQVFALYGRDTEASIAAYVESLPESERREQAIELHPHPVNQSR